MAVRKLYDEKELFDRIAGGDEKAFRLIFDLYKRRLYRFVFRISKSEPVSEELVQEVFLRLWSGRHLLSAVEQPGSFIFAVARNKALDHLRKVAREASLREQLWSAISEGHNGTQEAIEAGEYRELVKAAVDRLPRQGKLIYQLSRDEGLNHEQIARYLNISKSTVNNHLVQSLRRIRRYLEYHLNYLLLFGSSFFFCN